MSTALDLKLDDLANRESIAMQDILGPLESPVNEMVGCVRVLDALVSAKDVDPKAMEYITEMMFQHVKELKDTFEEQWRIASAA